MANRNEVAAQPVNQISKLDAARRQIETALDLLFDNKDSLSVHTLAWAAFKVLFDLYPHHNQDGFDKQLDALIGKEGWRALSRAANFLKHADKDPDAFLASHHPIQGMTLLGFATLLYRRISGNLTLKMMAFDCWTDELGYEQIGIEEVDENPERAAAHKAIREKLRMLPFEEMIKIGKHQYELFQTSFEEVQQRIADGKAEGLTITQIMDRHLGAELNP